MVGPAESENTVLSLEFSPGGVFHFKINFQGDIMYTRFLYKKIEPHDYLEFTNAFADEYAYVVPAPFDGNFGIKNVKSLESVELLGYNGDIKYTLNGDTLTILPPVLSPATNPCHYAWVFKLKNGAQQN